MVGVLLGFLLTVLCLAAGCGWLVLTPYGPQTETFVDLAPGSSAFLIGSQLEAAGIIRSRYAFDLMRFLKHGTLHAGEYRFTHPASVIEVYSRLVHGDVYTRVLVIPEGANLYEIATRVEQVGLGSRQQFLDAARSQTSLIADLDPAATSLEGYLFPATYSFRHNTPATQVVAVMVRRFRQVAVQLGLKKNFHRTVTMASLVERETAVDADRPLVASVFENRLAKNMPLQTDSAVIYGLEHEGHWNGQLRSNELAYDTPYNTYRHPGLTPGPIANPGLPSLRAALAPAHTGYYYFVAASANAQGHSLFAATLDEHNHNVAGYRRDLRKAGLR
ncbi:endolytic transglycosylase MltG [Telmatobacter bradus]|uniref:endolytic transglycosylase MltG n=1 Tax=Telmatobacter bradus TaxID=474953 RepID=UPI003B43D225